MTERSSRWTPAKIGMTLAGLGRSPDSLRSQAHRRCGRRGTVAIEAGKSGLGSVKTELRENAVGLPGMLMQGIATIAPSFAILASFVFIVTYAGTVTPWAYLFGGALLMLHAVFGRQRREVFPSAGGAGACVRPAVRPLGGVFPCLA